MIRTSGNPKPCEPGSTLAASLSLQCFDTIRGSPLKPLLASCLRGTPVNPSNCATETHQNRLNYHERAHRPVQSAHTRYRFTFLAAPSSSPAKPAPSTPAMPANSTRPPTAQSPAPGAPPIQPAPSPSFTPEPPSQSTPSPQTSPRPQPASSPPPSAPSSLSPSSRPTK